MCVYIYVYTCMHIYRERPGHYQKGSLSLSLSLSFSLFLSRSLSLSLSLRCRMGGRGRHPRRPSRDGHARKRDGGRRAGGLPACLLACLPPPIVRTIYHTVPRSQVAGIVKADRVVKRSSLRPGDTLAPNAVLSSASGSAWLHNQLDGNVPTPHNISSVNFTIVCHSQNQQEFQSD